MLNREQIKNIKDAEKIVFPHQAKVDNQEVFGLFQAEWSKTELYYPIFK